MPGSADILPQTAWHWVLFIAGTAALFTGVWMLARARRPGPPGHQHSTDQPPRAAGPSESDGVATGLATALLVIFLGYHLAAWGLPRQVVPFQVDRDWWWAVVLAVGVLAALSRAIDRWESRR